MEPFINTILRPETNIEVGCNFLIKYVFPFTEVFQPYIRGGLGILYMSQHTVEQATQWNLLPQIGLGFHSFIDQEIALSGEYRYRHLSNASIKLPNNGIDADLFLGGVAFFY